MSGIWLIVDKLHLRKVCPGHGQWSVVNGSLFVVFQNYSKPLTNFHSVTWTIRNSIFLSKSYYYIYLTFRETEDRYHNRCHRPPLFQLWTAAKQTWLHLIKRKGKTEECGVISVVSRPILPVFTALQNHYVLLGTTFDIDGNRFLDNLTMGGDVCVEISNLDSSVSVSPNISISILRDCSVL